MLWVFRELEHFEVQALAARPINLQFLLNLCKGIEERMKIFTRGLIST